MFFAEVTESETVRITVALVSVAFIGMSVAAVRSIRFAASGTPRSASRRRLWIEPGLRSSGGRSPLSSGLEISLTGRVQAPTGDPTDSIAAGIEVDERGTLLRAGSNPSVGITLNDRPIGAEQAVALAAGDVIGLQMGHDSHRFIIA